MNLIKHKKTTLILIIFLSFNQIFAQFGAGKIKDIREIKEVPLLVVLQEENDKAIKKIEKSKNGSIEQYHSDIENYNSAVRKGFEDSWNYSDEIKFITTKDLDTYNTKDNKRKYAFFKLDIEEGENGFSLLKNNGLITTYNYTISLTGEKRPVYSYMYTSALPNEADFKFISQQIQNYFAGREKQETEKKSNREQLAEFNKNAGKLKNKTLLLDKEDLDKKLIGEISDIYKFDYKLTSKREIDQAIMSNDESVAYLKIVPIGQITGSSGAIKASKLMFLQFIMDAQNGEILAFVFRK